MFGASANPVQARAKVQGWQGLCGPGSRVHPVPPRPFLTPPRCLVNASRRQKDVNPHTHFWPPLKEALWPSERSRPCPAHVAGVGAGAHATHSRSYSTRAWCAPLPSGDHPTEAREAQSSPTGCPIAGWRLVACPRAEPLTATPGIHPARHRRRSLLVGCPQPACKEKALCITPVGSF